MAPVVNKPSPTKAKTPRILVVDDEPALVELVGDVVGQSLDCKLIAANSIAEAKKIIAAGEVELLVADVNLPDGKGTELLASLRKHHPQSSAIVITGQPSIDGAITAIREGAVDFLPKPFTADHLLLRVNKALERQHAAAKVARRLDRLRDAVKRLNEARRLVSKKVDLLCNDLISAYGDLSKQLDVVRTQEGFRKLLAEAKDLEQMLCHAMDWLLRQLGYSNVAVWLAAEDGEFQLGAYMKYTTAGEPAVTEALKNGILRHLNHEGFIHLSADEARAKLTNAELTHLAGQTVLGVTCTYLGEVLAAVVIFRDAKCPFSEDDGNSLKAISPIFATALASMVKEDGDDDPADDGGSLLDGNDEPPKKKKKDKTSDADWWKRGEDPPF